MAGLLKPFAAKKLVKALRNEVGVPIHFHTHDTCRRADRRVSDGVRGGGGHRRLCLRLLWPALTSQPSLNALIEALRFHGSRPGIRLDFDELQETANLLGRRCASITPRSRRRNKYGVGRGVSARDAGRAVRRTCMQQAQVARPRRPVARTSCRTYAEP